MSARQKIIVFFSFLFVLGTMLSGLAIAEEVPYKTAYCCYLEEIVIDGYPEEWEEIIQFKEDPMYTGDAFELVASSVLYAAWDKDHLYFLIKVFDTEETPADSAEEFWTGDCIQVFIDGDYHRGEGYNQFDAQFWFCPVTGDEDIPYVGRYKRAGDIIEATQFGTVPGVEVAKLTVDDGYILEISVATSALGGVTLASGKRLGFNYLVGNIEVGNSFWATSVESVTYEHPNLWGTLELK